MSLKNLKNSQESTCAESLFKQSYRPLAKVFSCKLWEISKNNFSTEHLWATASTLCRIILFAAATWTDFLIKYFIVVVCHQKQKHWHVHVTYLSKVLCFTFCCKVILKEKMTKRVVLGFLLTFKSDPNKFQGVPLTGLISFKCKRCT